MVPATLSTPRGLIPELPREGRRAGSRRFCFLGPEDFIAEKSSAREEPAADVSSGTQSRMSGAANASRTPRVSVPHRSGREGAGRRPTAEVLAGLRSEVRPAFPSPGQTFLPRLRTT